MISSFAGRLRPSILFLFLLAALIAPAQTESDAPDFGLSDDLSGLEGGTIPPPDNALDKGDLEFYLRHLYIWPPEYTVEIADFEPAAIPGMLIAEVRVSYKLASQKKYFLISEDGKHILDGTAYQITENPFAPVLEKIDTTGAPGFGTPGAPVVLVVYSDFQCPYCAREAKMMRTQLLQEYPEQVRVYYRDFPLPKHQWAKPAALAGQCIYERDPETYWQYFDWVFENQRNITPQNFTAKLGEFLTEKSIDLAEVTQCVAADATEAKLKETMQEAAALGVRSTPTIFINGRKVGGVKWARLKQIIDNEIEYQKITQNAGDDCGCEMAPEIPGLQ